MAAWSGDTPAEMVSLCEGVRGQLRECQRYFGREKSMSGCQQLGKYVRSFRESPTQHVHVLDFVGGREAKVKASWKSLGHCGICQGNRPLGRPLRPRRGP